jgi:hypothetical protein
MTEPDQFTCTRRCPQVVSSLALRITRFLIAVAVVGRPGGRRAV